MGTQPVFQRGKTYDGRRGRRKYAIEGILTKNQKHTYVVNELPGLTQRRLSEDKLLELARLKKKSDNGVVYLSASQFQSFARCKRKWAFTYIDGEIAPGNASTDFGVEVHDVLENYLKTGQWEGAVDAVECARQGENMLPEPKDQTLGVEQQLLVKILDGRAMLIGYVDLVVPPRQGRNLLVVDHKSTKDFRYAVTADELQSNIQATIYSKWAMEYYRATIAETQWRYYCARPSRAKGTTPDGRPRNSRGFRAVSRIKTKAEVDHHWAKLMPVASEMVDLSSNQNIWAKDVEPNPDACGDYGGCPFRHLCDVKQDSIGTLMEHGKVAHLSRGAPEGKTDMSSLMDIINQNKAKQNAAATPPPLEQPATPPPAPVAQAVFTPQAQPIVADVPPPEPAPVSPLMAAATRALADRQQTDGAAGINPPPVEEEPLEETIEEATRPQIPQTWVDRYQKGHKARNADEEAWRAQQDALQPGERTVLAAGKVPDPTPAVPEPAPVETFNPVAELPVPTASEVVAAAAQMPNEVMPPPVQPYSLEMTEDPGPVATAVPVADLFVLMVDCLPAKGAERLAGARTLSELLRPMKDAVQQMKEVPHWNMVKYREGETLLAACVEKMFSEEGLPSGIVLADSFTGEWKACGDVLTELADVVIRGGR